MTRALGKATAEHENEAEASWNKQLGLAFAEILAKGDSVDLRAEISELQTLVLREYMHSYIGSMAEINKGDLQQWIEMVLTSKQKHFDYTKQLPATYAAASSHAADGATSGNWSGLADWTEEITALRNKIRRRSNRMEERFKVTI